MMNVNDMWDFLENEIGISEDFISGAVLMGGKTEDTMKAILYYATGYRDFDQYIELQFRWLY